MHAKTLCIHFSSLVLPSFQEMLLNLEGDILILCTGTQLNSAVGLWSPPQVACAGLWHTVVRGLHWLVKSCYLHGMKFAMVTRSGGWNPGPQ
jgi:hypothetical protein